MSRLFQSLSLALILVVVFVATADARQWTDRSGRTMTATYSRLDGTTVIMQQGLKVVKIPLRNLSDADQEYIRKQNGGKLPGEADDQPVAPNLPRPGFPNIQPVVPSLPKIVPHRYPLTSRAAIDEPRWWHQKSKLMFASVQSISWSSVTLCRKDGDYAGSVELKELNPTALDYVFSILNKAGQRDFIDKVKERMGRSAGSNPNDAPAADPGLAEIELQQNESREWFNGYDPVRGGLLEISESAVRIDDGTHFGVHLIYSSMMEEDVAYVVQLLEKHKANELADKITAERDSRGASRSETAASSEMRSWTLEGGQSRQGRITGFTFQGLTLVDPESKAWRASFRKLSDDDNKFLHGLADSQPDFKKMKYSLKSIGSAIAATGPVPGFPVNPNLNTPFNPREFPRPSFPRPSFPSPTPQPFTPQPFTPQPFTPQPFTPQPFTPPTFTPQPFTPQIPNPAAIPSWTPPGSGAPQMTAICENCKRPIPDSIGAGDHCPHCGTYFEYEVNADGSKTYAPGYWVGQWIGIGVFVLLVFAGIARRFTH